MGLTEKVTVFVRHRNGQDEYGEPVWDYEPNVIDNALVKQFDGERSQEADRPEGIDVEYTVDLPAALSEEELTGARIALTDRGQEEDDAMPVRRVVYVPQSPLVWKYKVTIGRFDG